MSDVVAAIALLWPRHEAAEQGLLIAKFEKGTARLRELELVFDVVNAISEVEEALPVPWLATVPNTLADVTFDDHYEARVVTASTKPFNISNVNSAWLQLCGFKTKRDCIGLNLRCIQGPETDFSTLGHFVNEIEQGRPADAVVVNYKQDGGRFVNYIRAFPLYSKSREALYADTRLFADMR